MSDIQLQLAGGARAYFEGVGVILSTAIDAERRQAHVLEARRRWPVLRDTPVGECRRKIGLVSKDGEVALRTELWVDISSELSVFTGRSVPVSVADIQQDQGNSIRGSLYKAEFEPAARAYWDSMPAHHLIAVEE